MLTNSEVGLELLSAIESNYFVGSSPTCRTESCLIAIHDLLAMKQDIPLEMEDEPLEKSNSKKKNSSKLTSEHVYYLPVLTHADDVNG